MGQYSVGKTSFIEYLLERPVPGMRIGPEPTTDSSPADPSPASAPSDQSFSSALKGTVTGEEIEMAIRDADEELINDDIKPTDDDERIVVPVEPNTEGED